ncbi:MAG: hypothetical protein CXZ00_10995 [Acidobacteria bacterium]|nr:MAG: hypothetical protein CXZ00_10995 [Acidobacteriota bacterium]
MADMEGYIAIDVPSLATLFFESEERAVRLVRTDEGGFVEMTKVEIDAILNDLDHSFPVRPEQSSNQIVNPNDQARIGSVRVGNPVPAPAPDCIAGRGSSEVC